MERKMVESCSRRTSRSRRGRAMKDDLSGVLSRTIAFSRQFLR
jgi:hypothetical protein